MGLNLSCFAFEGMRAITDQEIAHAAKTVVHLERARAGERGSGLPRDSAGLRYS